MELELRTEEAEQERDALLAQVKGRHRPATTRGGSPSLAHFHSTPLHERSRDETNAQAVGGSVVECVRMSRGRSCRRRAHNVMCS
jgi:hypothetical protein